MECPLRGKEERSGRVPCQTMDHHVWRKQLEEVADRLDVFQHLHRAVLIAEEHIAEHRVFQHIGEMDLDSVKGKVGDGLRGL